MAIQPVARDISRALALEHPGLFVETLSGEGLDRPYPGPGFEMFSLQRIGHSVCSHIGGQENGQLVQAITSQNAHVLAGKAVIVNACFTASTVGLRQSPPRPTPVSGLLAF